MNYPELISQLLMVVACIVIFVNIITEVIKKLYNFKTAQGINIFVTVISIILTLITCLTYCQIKSFEITWYIVIAFIIVGFMVAYAAMFGFDKLLKYFETIRENK